MDKDTQARLYNITLKAHALPGGGPLDRYRDFMREFMTIMYEEATGEKFTLPDAKALRPTRHEDALLQTQHVEMRPATTFVAPTGSGGVQLFAPGESSNAPHVQLIPPGQPAVTPVPPTHTGGEVPTGVENVPPGSSFIPGGPPGQVGVLMIPPQPAPQAQPVQPTQPQTNNPEHK